MSVLVSWTPSSMSGSRVFDSLTWVSTPTVGCVEDFCLISESFKLAGDTSSLELCSYILPTIGDRMSVQTSLAILAIVLGVVTVWVLGARLTLGVHSRLFD